MTVVSSSKKGYFSVNGVHDGYIYLSYLLDDCIDVTVSLFYADNFEHKSYTAQMSLSGKMEFFIGDAGIYCCSSVKLVVMDLNDNLVDEVIIDNLESTDKHMSKHIGVENYEKIKHYYNFSYGSIFLDDYTGFKYLGEEFHKRCKNVVDLGSNLGMFGVLASKYSDLDRYICVEPNVLLNDGNRIINSSTCMDHRIYNCAFSDTSGSDVDFYRSSNSYMSECYTTDKQIKRDLSLEDSLVVKTIDLRKILEDNAFFVIDFLKVNIEGSEKYLLSLENKEIVSNSVRRMSIGYHSEEIKNELLVLFSDSKFEVSEFEISGHGHLRVRNREIDVVNSKEDKILILLPHLSTGGMPQYVYWLVKELNKSKDVYVVEYSDIAPIYDVQKKRIRGCIGDNLITLYGSDREKKEVLFSIINKIMPDVIHLQEFPEMWLPNFVSDDLYNDNRFYKIVETTHGSEFDPHSKRYIPDRFDFISRFYPSLYRYLGVPYNIVEYPILKKERPDRNKSLIDLGLDPNKKHVLNVGLFTPGKNQGEIFRMSRNIDRGDVVFHFVGNQAVNFESYWGPLMQDKPDSCIVWGERGDVDKFYSCMDLFLFTSTIEANPIVIKEALGWSIPIFMYNLPSYCGCYDEVKGIYYLDNSVGGNTKRLLDFLVISGGSVKSIEDENILSYEFSHKDEHPKVNFFCLKTMYEGEECRAILRDLESNAFLYGFEFNFEKGIGYFISSDVKITDVTGVIFEICGPKGNSFFREVLFLNKTGNVLVEKAFTVGMTQCRSEINDFYNFLKDKDIKNVLEIGTERGGTFYLWCNMVGKSSKKISLDLPYTGDRNKKMLTWSDNVYIIEGDSHKEESLLRVEEILGDDKLDFLFIDGDHSYEGVKKDFEMYNGLVRDGGVIAFHDINGIDGNRHNSGFVSDFWGELNGDKLEFNEGNIDMGIGCILKNDKISIRTNDFEEGIFVIGAWISNEIQKDLLRDCIGRVRELGDYKIILVTHCTVDKDLVEMVDYHIYDKENPVLESKDYSKYNLDYLFYWENVDFRLELRSPYRHDFAVWSSMKNAFNFANYLGKKNIYYLEYDCVIDPPQFKREFIDNLTDYDACVLTWDTVEDSYFFNFFSIRTEKVLEIVNKYKSKEDFFEQNTGFNLVESTFCRMLNENNNNIYISNYSKDKVDQYCHIHDRKVIKNNFAGYILPAHDGENLYVSIVVKRDAPVRENEKVYVKFRNISKTYLVKYNNFDLFIFFIGSIEDLKKDKCKNDMIEVYNDIGGIFDISLEDAIVMSESGLLFFKEKSAEESTPTVIDESFEIGMLQDSDEIVNVYNFLKDKDIKNVLEIGSDKGGCFYLWCDIAGNGGKKISLDLPIEGFGFLRDIECRNKKMLTWSDNVYIIEGDSHKEESLLRVEEILGDDKLDFLFIDGDHSYEGVKKDFEMYNGLVRDGGVIAFHDIKDTPFHSSCGCRVSEFWKEIDGGKVEFVNDKVDFGGIGLLTVGSIKMVKKKKKYFISFDSKSLGDNLAWVPYVEEYRKKNNCNIVVSTFWNDLFEKEYPEIEFIGRGKVVHNIEKQFNIGWYLPWDSDKNPNDFKTIPLQQTASDILGLDYKEIKPKIAVPDKPRNIEEKYVCIGVHSTAQAKYWNYPNGWEIISDYLISKGYQVVHISKEGKEYMGNSAPDNIVDKTGDFSIEDRIVDLKYADMFIGVGSGLSWLSWAIGIPTILISGFSAPFCEPTEGIERIHNPNVCNSCFNDPNIQFDPGDWNWCPRNKDFECSKAITPDMVIEAIDKIIL